jgi:hypothetical protein
MLLQFEQYIAPLKTTRNPVTQLADRYYAIELFNSIYK